LSLFSIHPLSLQGKISYLDEKVWGLLRFSSISILTLLKKTKELLVPLETLLSASKVNHISFTEVQEEPFYPFCPLGQSMYLVTQSLDLKSFCKIIHTIPHFEQL
jgi:hypothetical protein